MNPQHRSAVAFNALVLPLVPALGAYTLWRRYGQKKSAASLRGQWGGVPAEVVRAMRAGGESAPRIWLHAVSVGESMAARPIARALRQRMPNCRIALSVTTDTGYATSQAARQAGEVDAVFYFPLDARGPVRRALRAIGPQAFLTVETELWPNFLHEAHLRGARTFLVNGRVSDNLLKQAPRLGWIWRWMMGNLDGALMRSQFDAQRLEQIGGRVGGSPKSVVAVGDVKLDTTGAASAGSGNEQWREILGVGADSRLWVAGSTHAGEEEIILRAYLELKGSTPDLRLLIAPRHIERVPEVASLIGALKQPVWLRSNASGRASTTCATDATAPVIVLDTVGELAQVYGAADVAFVGGSLIERGGHNLLEPVLRGVPVVFGPHTANFREAAALAQSAEVGLAAADEGELVAAVRQWLTEAPGATTILARADAALALHRGAAARIADIVAQSLKE